MGARSDAEAEPLHGQAQVGDATGDRFRGASVQRQHADAEIEGRGGIRDDRKARKSVGVRSATVIDPERAVAERRNFTSEWLEQRGREARDDAEAEGRVWNEVTCHGRQSRTSAIVGGPMAHSDDAPPLPAAIESPRLDLVPLSVAALEALLH